MENKGIARNSVVGFFSPYWCVSMTYATFSLYTIYQKTSNKKQWPTLSVEARVFKDITCIDMFKIDSIVRSAIFHIFRDKNAMHLHYTT